MPSSFLGHFVRWAGAVLSWLTGTALALALIVGSGVVLSQALGAASVPPPAAVDATVSLRAGS